MKNSIENKHEINKGYKDTQITQKKKRKTTKKQEEMLNLIGNKRNANKTIMEYDFSPSTSPKVQ